VDVQFEEARLYVNSGQFREALSEYMGILEWMEREMDIGITTGEGGHRLNKEVIVNGDNATIDEDDKGGQNGDIGICIDEIFKGLDTAVIEVLLESRKDELMFQSALDASSPHPIGWI
jgi:hypothetical protein